MITSLIHELSWAARLGSRLRIRATDRRRPPRCRPFPQSPPRQTAGAADKVLDLPRIQSRDLLQGNNLILIEHAGDRYYLRMTRNNKLILTK